MREGRLGPGISCSASWTCTVSNAKNKVIVRDVFPDSKGQRRKQKMTRRLILFSTAIVLASIASFTLAAGKSPVADAVEKGDKTTLRALLLVKTDVTRHRLTERPHCTGRSIETTLPWWIN